jgi:SNW domain-containing protein 1
VDGQGNIAYDAIAKRGHSSNQIVQSQFKDLVPLSERTDVGEISLSRPSQEEVNATAERTAAALEKISKCKHCGVQIYGSYVGIVLHLSHTAMLTLLSCSLSL